MNYLLKRLVFCIIIYAFCFSSPLPTYAIKEIGNIKLNYTSVEIGSSSAIDLKENLDILLGSEYSEVLKHTVESDIGTIRIYESMKFHILKLAKKPVLIIIAVIIGEIIFLLLGLISKSKLRKFICFAALTIVFILYILPYGPPINNYICQAKVYRYTTINDSKDIYNSTEKLIQYNGFENAAQGNIDRAYVDSNSQTITYKDEETYFNDYNAQANDAEKVFLTNIK